MNNEEEQSEEPGFACHRFPSSSRCLKLIIKEDCPAEGGVCCSKHRGTHPVYAKNILAASKSAKAGLGAALQCHEKGLNPHGSFVGTVSALAV